MQRKKPDVDVVDDVLLACINHYPENEFLKSLHRQYHERGGLSKKQLEGLYQKALKVKEIPVGKTATLQAIILKKKSKSRSEAPPPSPLYTRNEQVGKLIDEILIRFPAHKMILHLKNKYENNEPLGPSEVTEIERLHRILLK